MIHFFKKISIALILTIFHFTTHADPWACPPNALQNVDQVKLLHFLKNHQGKYSLGKCQIEIHVCNEDIKLAEAASSTSTKNELIADALVTNGDDDPIYIPFYTPSHNGATSDEFQFINDESFRYHFTDKLYKFENAVKKTLQVDFIQDEDSNKLSVIGIESTIFKINPNAPKYVLPGSTEEDFTICTDHSQSWFAQLPIVFQSSRWWYWMNNN